MLLKVSMQFSVKPSVGLKWLRWPVVAALAKEIVMAEAKPQYTPAQMQMMQEKRDADTRKKEAKAPTTKSGMGEGKLKFRSGGYVKSADGCAKRGKTKAKMV